MFICLLLLFTTNNHKLLLLLKKREGGGERRDRRERERIFYRPVLRNFYLRVETSITYYQSNIIERHQKRWNHSFSCVISLHDPTDRHVFEGTLTAEKYQGKLLCLKYVRSYIMRLMVMISFQWMIMFDLTERSLSTATLGYNLQNKLISHLDQQSLNLFLSLS